MWTIPCSVVAGPWLRAYTILGRNGPQPRPLHRCCWHRHGLFARIDCSTGPECVRPRAVNTVRSPMKAAALTFVFNESVNLPLWIKYYGSNFGEKNLFVVDRESTDGSTNNLGEVN